MDADPDPVRLVGEHVDIVVARADRAELVRGRLPQLVHPSLAPRLALIEEQMLGPLGIDPPHPEAQVAGDVVGQAVSRAGGNAASGRSVRTARLPQAMSKPTPETETCSAYATTPPTGWA